MSLLDNDLLDTSYGRLVARLVVKAAVHPGSDQEKVSFAIELADETLRQLKEKEQEFTAQATALAASRERKPITWNHECEGSRSGATWTSEEDRALGDQFDNGDDLTTISTYHARTPSAIKSRLGGLGRLMFDDKGRCFHHYTGESWF